MIRITIGYLDILIAYSEIVTTVSLSFDSIWKIIMRSEAINTHQTIILIIIKCLFLIAVRQSVPITKMPKGNTEQNLYMVLEIEKYPELYDKTNIRYKNIAHKLELWKKIGAKFHIKGELKFQTLLSFNCICFCHLQET